MSISLEPSVQFTSFLDTIFLRVCPTTRWHHFHGDDVMGCTQEHEMHPGWFSGLENTHNKERYNLEWFLSVFLDVQCPAYCNLVVFSLLCENNVQRKQEFLERQFFAPMAATMIYYEDFMTLPGWFEHNSLLILAELIYMMLALWDPDDMCYEMREPIFICTTKS